MAVPWLTRAPFLCLTVYLCCVLRYTSAEDQLPFPDVTKGTFLSYQTDARVTLGEQKSTYYVKQFYTDVLNVGRLDELREGVWYTYIYDPVKKVTIIDNRCIVVGIQETADVEEIPHWNYVTKDKAVIGPTAILLRGLELRNMTYKGTGTIRGILCNVWTTLDPKLTNLRLDFYFQSPEWEDPFSGSGLPKGNIPVRVEMHGNVKLGIVHVMRIEIDYYNFRPFVMDLDTFTIPPGRGCQGLQFTQPVPPIDFQYSFYAEHVDLIAEKNHPLDTKIDVFGVFYDGVTGIARANGVTNRIRFSLIQDYNTGAQYNLVAGACSMEPIAGAIYESLPSGDGIVAPNPLALLRLNMEYYPLGSAKIRTLKCNAWENITKGINVGNTRYDKLVTTYYFTEDWTTETTRGRKNQKVPTQMLLTGYKDIEGSPTFRHQINFYWFDQGYDTAFYQNFDISQCFTRQDQRKYFQMTFPSDAHSSGIASNNDNQFKLIGSTSTAVFANVSPIRLTFLQTDYEANRILVIGRLLERPPYGVSFIARPGLTDPGDNELDSGKATDQDNCAYRCLSHKEWKCRGFHYCSGQCFLAKSSEQKDWGHPVSSFRKCPFHIRLDMDSKVDDLENVDAIRILDAAITSKSPELSFTVEAPNGDKVKYTPNSFKIVASPFELEQPHPFEQLWKFYKLQEGLTTKTISENVQSVTECYRRCREEKGIFCSSFSFCKQIADCKLSSVTLDDSSKSRDNHLIPDTACNTYTVDFLKLFDKSPGQVMLSETDRKRIDATNPSECANSCKKETSFTCRGFDFCETSKTCTLHQRHRLELQPNQMINNTIGCSHYSLKYIEDYVMLGSLVLIDPTKQETRGRSAEDCARLCSENSEYSCQSFNYCPGTADNAGVSSCTLYSQDVQPNNFDISTNCDLYSRRPGLKSGTREQPSQPTGVTSSKLGGVIAGMLIFGFVLGIAGFLIVNRVRRRTPDSGMTIKFVKEDMTA